MKQLLQSVKRLRNSKVKSLVDARLQEFKETGKRPSSQIYKELCFCTLTANFDAEKSTKIQERVGNGFLKLSKKQLEKELRKQGYRYPNRAAYILESRKHKDSLKARLKSCKDESELRNWLAENVKGLGFKEASHFLRNVGFENLAIVDFHIVDLLAKHKLIEKPKTMTKKRYLEIEAVLKKIAEKLNMSLAKLDLYLWYMETGKVLK